MTTRGGAMLRAGAVLVVGFALMSVPVVQSGFDLLALGLTIFSEQILDLAGYTLARSGPVLRDLEGGWAIRVTEVCDGHGILFAWIAILAAHAGSPARLLTIGIAGAVAVQLFNLFRVLVLAGVLANRPEAFETVHLYVFPILTTALLAAMALLFFRGSALLARFVAVAGALSLGWFFVAEPVTAAVIVPVANALLDSVGPAAVGAIVREAADWQVSTNLLGQINPVGLLVVPIYPPDYTIALPMVAAAMLLAGSIGQWRAGLIALVIAVFALALGALTATWGAGETQEIERIALYTATGRLTTPPYLPPGEALFSAARLAQNVLVHFNLLVLPVLVLLARSLRSDA